MKGPKGQVKLLCATKIEYLEVPLVLLQSQSGLKPRVEKFAIMEINSILMLCLYR
jgi:hypothetical protein